METKTCVICGQEFEGYGNNAAPYANGTCCDSCNAEYVIPYRLELAFKGSGNLKESLEEEPVKEEIEKVAEPAEVDSFGLQSLFTGLIQDKFSQINEINSLLADESIKSRPEIVEILSSISDDLNIHVGQLQCILSYLDGNYQEKSEVGKDKAETVLSSYEAPEEKEEEEIQEPLKESLKKPTLGELLDKEEILDEDFEDDNSDEELLQDLVKSESQKYRG